MSAEPDDASDKGHTMYHDRAIPQRVPLPLLPARQQQTPHARRHPHPKRVYRTRYILHRIVYRQTGADAPARRVDVQLDRPRGVFGLEKEELGGEERGGQVGDGTEKDDAFSQEAGVDVV